MHIRHRNLFRLTRFILLKLPAVLKFFAPSPKSQKRLLIIKTDAIGDYILFRNFIEIIKQSEAFKGYRVDLLGNKLWEEIGLKHDAEFISHFIFIKPDALYDAPLQTLKLGFKLFTSSYETVLQPSFSRTFITDGLAGFTAAKNIIGFKGDTERIDPRYKIKTDKFYTQLIPNPLNVNFEFERSRFFVAHVVNQPVDIDRPFISNQQTERSGIIVFPGSSSPKRNWETDKFVNLLKLILQYTNHQIYIAGGSGDIQVAGDILENIRGERVSNLTGKTSLTQLIDLVGAATLVISNETSAMHIAAALKTPAVCILGGGHFGRFAPYPPNAEDSPVCVFEQMECYYCNWNCKFQTNGNEPYPCIAKVSLDAIWEMVLQLLET